MCGCGNELTLCKLCVKTEKAEHICACRIDALEICTTKLEAEHINAQDETVNNICVSQVAQAAQVQALNVNTNTLCARTGTINTLCVDNLQVSNPVGNDTKYKAAVTVAADINYTLGTPVDWNVILDDPNGNVALGPFSYTVPVTGYYELDFHLKSNTLAGAQTITGIPVGLLNILINGNPLRQLQSPFLSFSNDQNANLSSLVILSAGDVITMTYDTLVYVQVGGLIKYVGTINLEGNGAFAGESGFIIHFLSPLSGGVTPPVMCPVCPEVSISCQPLTVKCEPCMPRIGESHCKTGG